MIVAMLLVPALGVVIRNAPLVGLIFVTVFFGTNADGPLIFRATSVILFYIGGVAAVYRWNVLCLDKHAKVCVVLLCALCVARIGLKIDDSTLLVMAAPFLIWPAASLLRGTKVESWAISFCKYSFFIFVAHMPITDSLWWGVLRYGRWVPYPVYWFAAPILTVVVLKYTYDIAMVMAPRVFNFIIGARAGQSVRVDRRRAPRPAGAPIYTPEIRLTLTNT